MVSLSHLVVFVVFFYELEATRNVVFINNCGVDVWVSPLTNGGAPSLISATDIRRLAGTGGTTTYSISDDGWAGRFWPKLGCADDGQNCKIGQSQPPCPDFTGCTMPAETLTEFFFGKLGLTDKDEGGTNNYDISLVDGYSLPVTITPDVVEDGHPTCIITNCALKASDCPTNEHDGLGNLTMTTGQCMAPCKRWTGAGIQEGMGQNINAQIGLDYCCPSPVVNTDCQKGPVINSEYVKAIREQCPTAYSYSYDDINGLHQCANAVGFTVTYCG